MSAAPAGSRRRVRARVEGTVQGVGFRPYVHRLAGELGLGGSIRNDERGVLLEVEGPDGAVADFLARLPAEAPPLASVERVATEEADPTGELEFRIAASAGAGMPEALVSPDTAPCAECIAEMLDSADRRHRYPFINCTNCGPRFSIVRGVPYDRPRTTMAGFEMCPRCAAEYEDPADRRFHAQPIACPDCGPRAWLAEPGGAEIPPGRIAGEAGILREDAGGEGAAPRDAVAAAALALRAGRVVAIKGVGGFHLACRADDEGAVAALRSRKYREDKPFALMVADAEMAERLVILGEDERALLESRERPVVVARRGSAAAEIARSVAPASPDLGVMLPYSPLHHLLLADAGLPLVMTSGNASDEPIAYRDEDALERLSGIADLFLLHDRPIETRTDDSVARGSLMLRRSRGYVPASVALQGSALPLLACGAELKNTFCVAKGGRAWVGHHIGDLENYETLASFAEGIEHFQRLFAVEPELVVHDMHPEYLSTKYAREREGVEHLAVQHHHAHLAACLAEHGEEGPAIGAIFDGTGYGPDGTIWGGELLAGGCDGFERAGMLWPARLPGGAAAIREPWRMACAWLAAASGEYRPAIPPALADSVDPARWDEVCELVRTGVASPLTTSAGRLFDAVAAICGAAGSVGYEGQAAAEFEGLADRAEHGELPLPLLHQGPLLLDARELVAAVRDEMEAGAPAAAVSARFHNALAAATARALAAAAEERGTGTVVLSGGVFQNRLLLERTLERLGATGLRVLVPRALPPNDGGISYGQAAVAAARR
ncbi:MAG: carbamoyltransferase HypF [Solirubrobacterales bacterium]